MSDVKDGGPGDLPPVEPKTPNEVFENAIRAAGVANACEYFGHVANSDFTKETIQWLKERGPK